MALRDIQFFYEEVDFKLKHLGKLRSWLQQVAKNENSRLRSLNCVFCSDEYLLEMNKSYLDHHYYTDIITFDNSIDEGIIEGDLFISIDRAAENAIDLKVDQMDEIHRLMVHGLLHLLGYQDKEKQDKALMTQKEDYYLSLLTKFSI